MCPGLFVGNFGAASSFEAERRFKGIVCAAPNWRVRNARMPYYIFDIASIVHYSRADQLHEIQQLILFVGTHLLDGSVLLHCRAGHHRAASTMACILLACNEHICGFDAIRQVERTRPGARINRELRSFVFAVERMQRPIAL